MTEEFKRLLIQKHQECKDCPSNEAIQALFQDIMALLFPNFSDQRLANIGLINVRVESIQSRLSGFLMHHPSLCATPAKEASQYFVSRLENIEKLIKTDVDAIFNGDPAAKTKEEIIRSYPGFFAIAAYRIAHELYQMGVKIIPRIITEHAHHRTGIDIHPGAKIDHSFCIDHGTGVVIGETSIIGHHVKIYQGVTLGALSVNKEDANNKRHPTIEPYVVIYANATVLGGKTTIGQHSIIGGNVWITNSVEAHSTIYYVTGSNQVTKNKIEE